MPISVAVPKEILAGERRVALVPDVVARLTKSGFEVLIQRGAGTESFQTDEAYEKANAKLVDDNSALAAADVILKVQPPTNEEIDTYKESSILVCFMQPHRYPEQVARIRDRGITSFAMELIPRITRAQSMDALSSQATVAGYKSVLIAADRCSRFFPMLTTAAGTIRPAKVLILGAGVAGLQAIATARRLGAIVEAYDVRRAAREQVESLGAKFLAVELDAEAAGGYARELTDEEKQREQVMLWKSVGQADVVITTAQIPGRQAPRLVSAEMVNDMKPGAVVVDLAAESGGNCELTEAGKEINHNGVILCGPENVPSMLSVHASEMYSKNIFNFVSLLCKESENLNLDWEDEIIASSAVTHERQIKHEPTQKLVAGG